MLGQRLPTSPPAVHAVGQPREGRDELRAIVLMFVVSRHDDIGNSESFLSLVGEGGIFAQKFWQFVRKIIEIRFTRNLSSLVDSHVRITRGLGEII
jgi:hypothetical protein